METFFFTPTQKGICGAKSYVISKAFSSQNAIIKTISSIKVNILKRKEITIKYKYKKHDKYHKPLMILSYVKDFVTFSVERMES